MKRIPMFILLAVITCPIVNGGEQDIKKKERALEQLRKEIDAYEQRIEQSEKKEKVTLERIDNYEKQATLFIPSFQSSWMRKSSFKMSIALASDNITFLEKQLSFLKQHYANM